METKTPLTDEYLETGCAWISESPRITVKDDAAFMRWLEKKLAASELRVTAMTEALEIIASGDDDARRRAEDALSA